MKVLDRRRKGRRFGRPGAKTVRSDARHAAGSSALEPAPRGGELERNVVVGYARVAIVWRP